MDRISLRVLVDANVFISYLLPTRQAGTIESIVEAAIGRDFTLLFPADLAQELVDKVATKRYLTERISTEEVDRLIRLLSAVAETVSPVTTPIAPAIRDLDDSYLLAYALVGQADYLVSGDADLLVLGEVGKLKIVTPGDFVRLLNLNAGKGE